MQPPLHLLPLLLLLPFSTAGGDLPIFLEAPAFRNGPTCPNTTQIHIAMTLDKTYLRGSIAAVYSVLRHSMCPESISFHFFISTSHRRLVPSLRRTVASTFPSLPFSLHRFDPSLVKHLISSSLRPALENPLNYARIYLADLIPRSVERIIYLDSDLILVDDVARLWGIDLKGRVLGAPQYCHANFSSYFTDFFWSDRKLNQTFLDREREPCYFNTGVMVIDLSMWRAGGYTAKLEKWMRMQRRYRVYELGSLPPFLLVFAGAVEAVEHRWNQHGLGGDNVEGRCRDLHPGPVSLLHWSGKGKPWIRIDAGRACPLDRLWAAYDLICRPSLISSLLFGLGAGRARC